MLSDVDYDICKTQGRVYRYAGQLSYDPAAFSEYYLRSDFCRRAMDSVYSRFQYADEEEIFYFLDLENVPESGTSGKDGFPAEVLYWIGFTYRHLAFASGKPSGELAKLLPFDTMVAYYPGLHTVDEDMAVEIILENPQKKNRA